MKVRFILFIITVSAFTLFTGCKSEYEKIRQSNDPELMYKKGLELYDEEEFERAQVLLEQSISAYRGQKEAEELFFKYAYTHFYLKQYILSAHYFNNFANTFINSENREEAEFMAAYSNVQNSPSYRLDQEYTNKAIDGLQQFVNTYPESERVSQCNELIDELRQKLEKKMFEEGKLYFDLSEYQSADRSFSNLLKTFPETQNGEEIRFLMVYSAYNLAKNSVYEKRATRYDETINRVEQFLKKYPDSKKKRDVLEVKNLAQEAKKELKS
jgi:outer membrane protein assembly factor BamD